MINGTMQKCLNTREIVNATTSPNTDPTIDLTR